MTAFVVGAVSFAIWTWICDLAQKRSGQKAQLKRLHAECRRWLAFHRTLL